MKQRDPSSKLLQQLRRSGAMGAHKSKKHLQKSGYNKHKSKYFDK